LRNAWTLTKVRMRLALRNRAFIFFGFIFPLIILVPVLAYFARYAPAAIPYALSSVLAITVMGSFQGLSVQLVTFREQGILRRFRVAPASAPRGRRPKRPRLSCRSRPSSTGDGIAVR